MSTSAEIAQSMTAQLKSGYTEFAQFVQQTVAALESQRQQLCQREAQLLARSEELVQRETHLRELGAQLKVDDEALQDEAEQVKTELQDLAAELEAYQGQVSDLTTANDGLKRDVHQLEEERGDWQRQRDELQRQMQAAEQAMQEAEQLAEQAQAVGQESDSQLRLDLEHVSAELSKCRARIEELESSHPLQAECRALEDELEIARRRAAESAQLAAQSERQLNQQRQRWEAELTELKATLEARYAHQEAGPQPASAAGSGDAPRRANPVVDSVLAQFAQLQRDAAHRRGNR